MILCLTSDLLWKSKFRAAAQQVNAPLAVQQTVQHGATDPPADQVSAVFIDLDPGPPAIAAITDARSAHPGARIIAFGPHVQTDLFDQAARAGADQTIARGTLAGRLPAMLADLS